MVSFDNVTPLKKQEKIGKKEKENGHWQSNI
jgi:hypothetical protein